MNIIMIVLSLIAAYVIFVSVFYLLIRLIFPKIEVEEEKEHTERESRRYALRTSAIRKQKNLAY